MRSQPRIQRKRRPKLKRPLGNSRMTAT
jgi:hypothetical protein